VFSGRTSRLRQAEGAKYRGYENDVKDDLHVIRAPWRW